MTDLYLEQATTAFQQLWSGGGQISLTIPQIAETFVGLQRTLKQSDCALQLAVRRVEAQEDLITKLRDDVGRLYAITQASSRRLDLLESAEGFVTRSALFEDVRSMPEVEGIKSLREQVHSTQKKMAEMTADHTERLREMEARIPETMSKIISDENGAIRQQVRKLEEEHYTTTQRLTQTVTRIPSSIAELQASTTKELRDAFDTLSLRVRQSRDESHSELEASMSEVIAHLKQQAKVVDSVTDEMRKKYANIPTIERMDQMKEEMIAMRGDLDKAQFRIHEAYSQAMTVSRLAARDELPVQQVDAKQLPSAPTAIASNSKETHAQASPHATNTGLTPLVDSIVEPIKKDVAGILTVTLPSLTMAIKTQRDEMDAMVRAHHRAQELMEGFFACVGLKSRFDEIVASIEVQDASHVLLMMKKALDTVRGDFSSGTAADRSAGWSKPGGGGAQAHSVATPNGNGAPFQAFTPKRAITSNTSVPPHYQRSREVEETPSLLNVSPIVGTGANNTSNTIGGPSSSVSRPNGAKHSSGFQLGVDAADYKSRGVEGAQVMAVVDNSAAMKCGLRPGDVVVRVNSLSVDNAQSFAVAMKAAERHVLGNGGSVRSIALHIVNASSGVSRQVDVPVAQ